MKKNYFPEGGVGILRKLRNDNPEKSTIKSLNGERLLNIKKIMAEGQSKNDTSQ